MAWDEKYARQEKYAAKSKSKYHCVSIRFSRENDSDILSSLPVKNTTTRIKELIRIGLAVERNAKDGK